MPAELLETVTSLTQLIVDETAMLAQPARRQGLGELIAAKAKLFGKLEARLEKLTRETPDWVAALPTEMREALRDAAGALTETARVNGTLLGRQIALSDEIIAAIARDAQRRTGARAMAYGALGTLWESEQPTPIAVNTRL
ncbi:MAG: hypothetical protein ACTHMG_02070 [Sphingomonas sp.]